MMVKEFPLLSINLKERGIFEDIVIDGKMI
jgi:hypothetical protein